MSPLYVEPDWDACCYLCVVCERKVCKDWQPSPGESENVCAECCAWDEAITEQLEALETAVAAGPPPYDETADTSLSPKTSPCPYCNDTGWVETTNYYSGEVTRTRCYSTLNHGEAS